MPSGEDEALEERIEQPERQIVMLVAAMHRFVADVAQRVVHPGHVPFVREARHCQSNFWNVFGCGSFRP